MASPETSERTADVSSGDEDDHKNVHASHFENERSFETGRGNSTSSKCSSLGERWASFVEKIREPPLRLLLFVTNHAATKPRRYAISIILFSIFIVVIGLLTNFKVDVDEDILWTPKNSKPVQHGDWIDDESGFPEEPRYFQIIVHADSKDVLGEEGVKRVFESLDVARSTPGYEDLCALSNHVTYEGKKTCAIHSITRFWNQNQELFGSSVSSNEDAILAMSAVVYPDNEPVDRREIFGNAQPQIEKSDDVSDQEVYLTFAQSYLTRIELPPSEDESEPFEKDAIDNLLDLQDKWIAEEGNIFRVEVMAYRSFSDEFGRAIVKDIPLLPIVFIIMSIFCCLVFAKRHKVRSQSLLGFGAVVNVLLSILTGYGLLFTIGIPFTSLTQILPFIMFGIGLDDAFIIAGAFERTDPKKDAVDRVRDAMTDVGASVMLTTLTTFVAFTLGCTSSIPAVYWLCVYAFPTVLIDFIYQITFFVALLVMDERRRKANRYDCCFCRRAEGDSASQDDLSDKHVAEHIMTKYCNVLMKPQVKAFVIVFFMALLGVLAYSTSQLEQAFDFTDMVPDDSYLKTFFDVFDNYSERLGFRPGVYFRNVDVAKQEVRDAMLSYVDNLVELEQISDPPKFFWLRDFLTFTNNNKNLTGNTFNENITAFLDDSVYYSLYSEDMVRNSKGDLTASRTWVFMDNVDGYEVKQQIDALLDQREVTENQPINEGLDDWAFFNFDGIYYIWEFYSVAKDELILSTVLGVVAVSLISLFLVPHWSATLFVSPMVIIVYVDLLGFIQAAGLYVNSVTYIGMVMSIGLMVDYVMHVVIKYMESEAPDREGKVRDVLQTMGASILIGGTSTLLGVVPLAFSTSEIFWTVFIVFLGLVVLGISHGLILMPVVLSIVGPLGRNIKVKPRVQNDADSMVAGTMDLSRSKGDFDNVSESVCSPQECSA